MIERLKVLRPSYTFLEDTCFKDYNQLHEFYKFIKEVKYLNISGNFYQVIYSMEDNNTNFKGDILFNLHIQKDFIKLDSWKFLIKNVQNKQVTILDGKVFKNSNPITTHLFGNKLLHSETLNEFKLENNLELEYALDSLNKSIVNILIGIYLNRTFLIDRFYNIGFIDCDVSRLSSRLKMTI